MRTVRSEVTDRLLFVNDGHLRGVLGRYICHYNQHRPYRTLLLRPPQRSSAPTPALRVAIAAVHRQVILGGLINE